LGADTIVVAEECILEKPGSQDQAVAMLQQLAGATHEVMTSVALVDDQQEHQCLVKTAVTFRDISVAESQRYWQTGEPRDKAGGYGIQGLGAIFVQQIAGSYSNVVGLPLFETAELLAAMGIACWHPASA